MLNLLNVYRIPASAVILKSSRCFAPRVEKMLRNRNSRTISLRQSVALRDRVAVCQSILLVVSLRGFHHRALEYYACKHVEIAKRI